MKKDNNSVSLALKKQIDGKALTGKWKKRNSKNALYHKTMSYLDFSNRKNRVPEWLCPNDHRVF